MRAVASVWTELQRYEEMLRAQGRSYRRVAELTLDWVIDEGGRPLLFDLDVDGAQPSDDLPLSHKYALDALQLLGVAGYARKPYQADFLREARPFCAARRCTQRTADALQDLVDEAHHSGAFARLFPPPHGRGCAPYCELFAHGHTRGPGRPASAAGLPRAWPLGAGVENLNTWAFLRRYQGLLPTRTLPTNKPIFGMRGVSQE